MAPRPKPAALKKLAGNPGKRPVVEDAKPPDGKPAPPPRGLLPPRAQRFYKAQLKLLEESGRLSPMSASSLLTASMHYELMVSAYEELRHDGIVVEGYRGSLVKSPALQAMRDNSASLLRWLSAAGLTPASLRGVPEQESDEPSDFEKFLSRWKSPGPPND